MKQRSSSRCERDRERVRTESNVLGQSTKHRRFHVDRCYSPSMAFFHNRRHSIAGSRYSVPHEATNSRAERSSVQTVALRRAEPVIEIALESWSVGRDPRLRFSLGFINRVLVKEVGSLRDLIRSLPALRAVRLAFEGAKLTVLVTAELASFFDGMSWIDEVIPHTAAPSGRPHRGHRNTIKAIRARQFDLAIIFERTFSAALWVTLAGIPRRAGYATDGRGLLLTHRAPPPADADSKEGGNYWDRMLRDTLGVAPITHAQHHILEVDSEHRTQMRTWLTAHGVGRAPPLIAIAPFASYGKTREWPAARFAALIQWIAKRYSGRCVLVGTEPDRKRCEQLVKESGPNAVAMIGETSIGQLTALLSLCDGFVGNDTGVTLLADALGLPTIGILGSTTPAEIGPVGQKTRLIYHQVDCSPCLARTCPFEHYNCLLWVTPHEITDALEALGAFKSADESSIEPGWLDWQREWHGSQAIAVRRR